MCGRPHAPPRPATTPLSSPFHHPSRKKNIARLRTPTPPGLLAGQTSLEVHQCKAVACIKLEQYGDAVEATRGHAALSFLHAYALYKLERHAEALSALGSASSGEPAHTAHLRAQVAYKQGAYAEAARLYAARVAALEREGGDAFDVQDAQLNMLAALVSGGRAGAALDGSTGALAALVADVRAGRARELELPYELLYNVACALLDVGDARGAHSQLAQALALGAECVARDGGDEAAVQAELAPVRAQAALLLAGAHFDEAAGRLFACFSAAGGRARGRAGAGGGGGGGGGGARAGAGAPRQGQEGRPRRPPLCRGRGHCPHCSLQCPGAGGGEGQAHGPGAPVPPPARTAAPSRWRFRGRRGGWQRAAAAACRWRAACLVLAGAPLDGAPAAGPAAQHGSAAGAAQQARGGAGGPG